MKDEKPAPDYYRCFDCGATFTGYDDLPKAALDHRNATGHLRFEIPVR